MLHARLLQMVAASNAAFFTLFGVFVVAMLVLIFLTLRWVIRRDRAGRRAWVERQVARQQDAEAASGASGSPPSGPRP